MNPRTLADKAAPWLAAGRGARLRHRAHRCGTRPLVGRGLRLWAEDGSRLVLGDWVCLFEQVSLTLRVPGAEISIGDQTYIGPRTELWSVDRVAIGRYCAIGPEVIIRDNDAHWLSDSAFTAPVVVGDYVWISARAMIMKGVTIGDGAVVAAGAIVTSDVPARALVAGVPAGVVREDVTWR